MPKISPIINSAVNNIKKNVNPKNIEKNVEKAMKMVNSDSYTKYSNSEITNATKGMFLQTPLATEKFKSMEDALLASGYNVRIDDTIAKAPKSLTHAEAVAKFDKKIV